MAPANLVVGIHADAVHGRRVELNNVGLVVGGRDLAGGVFELPRVYKRNDKTLLYDTSVQAVPEHCIFWRPKRTIHTSNDSDVPETENNTEGL